MRSQRAIFAALFATLLTCACAARSAPLRQLSDQDIIVAQLLEARRISDHRTSLERRSELVRVASNIPAEKRTTRLWIALRDELMFTAEERRSMQGEAQGEHLLNVAEIVTEWKDRMAIVPLATVIETGGGAMHALAAFGEEAAPTVIQIAMLKDTSKAHSALLTLTLMMNHKSLLPGTRATVTDVARKRLYDKQGVAVLSGAAALAVATGDPALRSRVEQLLSDRNELAKCGVTSLDDINFFLEVANDALKGKGWQ